MIGTHYQSEMSVYTDESTGRKVTRLTNRGINFHMYFTDNSVDLSGKQIYFLSNRSKSGEIYDLFRMDLSTGIMTQLTDEPEGITYNIITKTPDSEILAYKTGTKLRVLNQATGEIKTIFDDDSMNMGAIHISPDKKKIGFARNERFYGIPGNTTANYGGFYDRFYAIKDGRVSVMNIDGTDFRDVFKDTHQLAHFQFAPDDSDLAIFCHEGPWNLVQQRIWILNLKTGDVIPCFRQGANDSVGHGFWTRDGLILFDNRGPGHDGTITSDKKQICAETEIKEGYPYFGFADKNGEVLRTIPMPFYCNHYHANNDNTLFTGDGVEDIMLIRVKGQEVEMKPLAKHNTTWKYHRSHCHPTFSWDGKKILYTADRDETHCDLYLVDAEF